MLVGKVRCVCYEDGEFEDFFDFGEVFCCGFGLCEDVDGVLVCVCLCLFECYCVVYDFLCDEFIVID